MQTRPAISVIFPAYNEEARLEATLRETAEYFRMTGEDVELIAVDDGSRDGTSPLVHRLADEYSNLRLIRLAANRGKGHAVRTGVLNARGELVLFADADGATPISEVERLKRAIAEGADVAIGSRAAASSSVEVRAKLYRRIIGRAFHMLVSGLTVKGILDTQCGFKMFRSAVAHDLFSRMRIDGFSFDVEVLLMAQRQGLQIAEVPVNWEHKAGSRVNLVTDSFKMAIDLFVIRGHAIRGRYDQPHVTTLFQPSVWTAEPTPPSTVGASAGR